VAVGPAGQGRGRMGPWSDIRRGRARVTPRRRPGDRGSTVRSGRPGSWEPSATGPSRCARSPGREQQTVRPCRTSGSPDGSPGVGSHRGRRGLDRPGAECSRHSRRYTAPPVRAGRRRREGDVVRSDPARFVRRGGRTWRPPACMQRSGAGEVPHRGPTTRQDRLGHRPPQSDRQPVW